MTTCEFGCGGDDVAVHYGWYRCTPEARAMLAIERGYIKLAEQQNTDEDRAISAARHARRGAVGEQP